MENLSLTSTFTAIKFVWFCQLNNPVSVLFGGHAVGFDFGSCGLDSVRVSPLTCTILALQLVTNYLNVTI